MIADEVVVLLEAKIDKYNRDVQFAVRSFEKGMNTMRQDAVRAETQIRKSFAGIRTALLSSVSGFAGLAGAKAIQGLLDGYTRYTNQLKVAGLEGQRLSETQNQLYAIAQKSGTPLELLGRLYGGLSSLQKDLNTTSKDSLALTQAVSNAIKVNGSSAESSAGAILGLNQALAQTRVQSDEYNQILDGARPLLQAAANASDKYRGSLAKLKQDIEAGKVSGAELFRILQAGFPLLAAQAEKANLTIAQSFTVLNNALGKYIGETDQALSLTARISVGIKSLADNLDVIVPALAGIVAAYATMKVGSAAFDAVTAATGRALDIDKALAAQVLLGNASYLSRTQAVLTQATATSAAAAAEVAALEAEVVARTAAVAVAAAEIREKQTLIAASGADAVAREALTAAVIVNTEANAALIASEAALAVAQGRAAAAAEAEAVAVAAATTAKRAGAAGSALFAGSLTAIGAALPIIAVAALTAAVIYYATASKNAALDTKAFAEEGETLAANLAAAQIAGNRAAGAIQSVGTQAAVSTPKILAFANATGEAAQRLYDLARARRAELLEALKIDETRARQQREDASARVSANSQSQTSIARFGYLPQGGNAERAQAEARATYTVAAQRERAAQEAQDRVRRTALPGFLSGSEREGGRDVEGDLSRVTRDLTIARERGIKSTIDSLEAQQFEIKQYKKYRKEGLSPQAAQEASNKDKSEFQSASQGAAGDRSARANATAASRAERAAAAEARDVAGDAARYSSLERRANNDIAAAKAELANSAEERAAIEKARIEDERQNRNEELRQSFNQGQLGNGANGKARLLELQRLNDEKAALDAQVVEQHERQRIAQEASEVALANLGNEQDLLQAQIPLLDTSKERREAALRLLDIQYQQERIELEAITVANGRTKTEEDIAKARLAQLDRIKSADRQSIERQHETPSQAYLRDLEKQALNVSDAFEDIEVRGLESLNDGITDAIMGAKSLGDAFKGVANQIIADLLRIAIRQSIVMPLAGALFGDNSAGGFLSSLFGGSSSAGAKGVNGKASGGPVAGGQFYRINEGARPGHPEGFVPAGGGTIVPLGRMNVQPTGTMGAPSVVRVEVVSGEMFDTRVTQISGTTAVEVVRIAAPVIADQGAAKALGAMTRGRL